MSARLANGWIAKINELETAGRIETMRDSYDNQLLHDYDRKQRLSLSPLALLRYPGAQAGESTYVVIRPSSRNSDVYEVASSWFDGEAEGLEELRQMREARGERR
jgi:hypothetical protein